MHQTSYETMRTFVRVHLEVARGRPLEILDFGSQVVDEQGLSYAGLFDDPAWTYRGLDIEPGHNVDVVVADPYDWGEVVTDSVDLVVSGQAFEHVEFFWASMFEIVRVLRPGGLAAIIAPSGGFEHRYPVDCWRFYPDGFRALARYVGCELVDVFTDWGHGEWDDSILVARKPDWDDAGRAEFGRRAALQRSLLPGSHGESGEPVTSRERVPTSVLAAAECGALTAELEARRAERVAAAERELAAAEAEQRSTVDAEIERRIAERIDAIAPMRWYGRARSSVAGLAGERGRRAYKRLRGRA